VAHYIDIVRETRPVDFLLEFVLNDSPGSFSRCGTLRRFLEGSLIRPLFI